MVRHIVMWKLKEMSEEGKIVAKNNIKTMLEALVGKIEGLQSLEVGFNYKSGSYDLCLVGVYDDKDALEFYQNHPEHIKCKEYIHTVIAERGFCDYEF